MPLWRRCKNCKKFLFLPLEYEVRCERCNEDLCAKANESQFRDALAKMETAERSEYNGQPFFFVYWSKSNRFYCEAVCTNGRRLRELMEYEDYDYPSLVWATEREYPMTSSKAVLDSVERVITTVYGYDCVGIEEEWVGGLSGGTTEEMIRSCFSTEAQEELRSFLQRWWRKQTMACRYVKNGKVFSIAEITQWYSKWMPTTS